MPGLVVTPDLYAAFRTHMESSVEQVGFFLADFDVSHRRFALRDWRPIPPDGFELQSTYHVTLSDDARAEVIRWAWESGPASSLVEAHSHGDKGPAAFSPSDTFGFTEWVPHLWWRLRGRPYAAIVTAGDTFDALAWIDSADAPEQITYLELVGERRIDATGGTLASLGRAKRSPHAP